MSDFRIDFLVGCSEEDLLTIKLAAITAIKNGSGSVVNVTSFNAPGLSVSYFTSLPPDKVYLAANYALNRLEKKVVKRTHAVFK